MRVLIVEDEAAMAELLSQSLQRDKFTADRAADLDEASAALRLAHYSLVLLDRRLNGQDGLSLLPEVRAYQPQAGVLVLSALADVHDRVAGLDAGADDYLIKPFDADELRARVRAAIRRPRPAVQAPPIVCGRLVFQPDDRLFRIEDQVLDLRRREMAVLEIFMQRARRVVQRETLIRAVYAFDEEPSSNTLDAHISRLRRRLQKLNAGVIIHAVRGVGYVLDDAP